ncbi:hypothetical protein [Mycobacterium sp. 48b]|uniref:hypothetical protein n=1 Tax=Mycobacterium sp. 48b TaxID=3400426 RepID=UPI003AAE50FD
MKPRVAPGLITIMTWVALTFGLPATATAAPPPSLSGTFTVTKGQDQTQWTVRSACTPHCVATVRSSQGWRGYASLDAGVWTMSVYTGGWARSSYAADPTMCVNTAAPQDISQTFSFDSQTLTGSAETWRGDRCSGPRAVERVPLALSRMD